MKILITLILFTTISNKNEVDKIILPYSIVTSKADLIVEGEIENIYDEKYDFTVSEFIKGSDKTIISVSKWEEWMCDTRQIKYKTGQNLILFLKKEKGKYDIINGSTGELIINDDDSLLRYEYQTLPNKSIVKEGIKLLIKSIDYKGKLYSKGKFKFLVSQSEFDKYKTENEFYYKSTRGLDYAE
ncbi:hypothetical protein [Aquimarina macrocephali]|uniref:hypothetical protein n=1 Tax=Aquimarina macrocephali TaxID=666563 RepID=UPI003F66AEF7